MKHRFIIRQNDLPRSTAVASFATEAFEDVTVEFGPVRMANNTYVVDFTSSNECSLDQAAQVFRSLAIRMRAIDSDNRHD